MIEILSSPVGQVGFTDTAGVAPYLSKYNIPINKLEYANSVYNVLSYGIDAVWKTNTSGVFSTSYSGKVPRIKFYYGEGIPETILTNGVINGWSVDYDFYFKAPFTANYSLYFGGSGTIEDLVVNDESGERTSMTVPDMDFNDDGYNESSSFSMVADNSYQITFTYKNILNKKSGLVMLWETDSAYATPDKIVMSAGVCAPGSDNTFPSYSRMDLYSNVKLTENVDGSSNLTFELPFVSTSTDYGHGYRFVSTTDSYVHVDSASMVLKKYRNVRFSSGFLNGSEEEEFVTKFTGQIRDIKVKHSRNDIPKLEVLCFDYSIFTKDTINIDAPNPIDYVQAGYFKNIYGRVNGKVKPSSFDGWEVHKAYEVLMTESYIDPYSFYNRKKYSDYSSTSTTGGFLVEPIESDNSSWLPIGQDYGTSLEAEAEGKKPDGEYGFKIDTGEFYRDAIDKILKPWFYSWGINREGYPYLRRTNTPYTFINTNETTGDFLGNVADVWRREVDYRSFGGSYLETSTVGAIASCDAVGKKFILMLGVGPSRGSDSGDDSIRVTIKHDATTISTIDYNSYLSEDRYYSYGADASTGVNYSKLNIANGLPYDSYRIVVEVLDNKEIAIEGVLAYNEEDEVNQETYYTSDSVYPSIISSLDIKTDIENHRTDCIVLGQRTGSQYRLDENKEKVIVNPNNEISTYVQSAARNLSGVYNSSALNYVGRPRTVLIVDPSIISQEQADFISFNTIAEYSQVRKNITFGSFMNPLLEVSDVISVEDSEFQSVSSSNYLWVESIQSNFSRSPSLQINTSPIKPVDSYWILPELDVENDFGGVYVQNLQVKNRGYYTSIYSVYGNIFINLGEVQASDTAIAVKFFESDSSMAYELIPYSGYFMIGDEIVKYNGFTLDESFSWQKMWLHNCERGQVNTTATHWVTKTEVVIGFLPNSKTQSPPIVSFDLLAESEVEINIRSYNGNTNNETKIYDIGERNVDSLSDPSRDLDPYSNYSLLRRGHHERAWGGYDRLGDFSKEIDRRNHLDIETTKNFYLKDNYLIKGYDLVNSVPTLATSRSAFGYAQIRVKPVYKEEVKKYNSNDSTANSWIYNLGNEKGLIRKITPGVAILDLEFSTSGMYVLPGMINPAPDGGIGNVDGISFDYSSYRRRDSSFLGDSAYANPATSYPFSSVTPTEYSYYGKKTPVFVLNKSNEDSILGKSGFYAKIKDYSGYGEDFDNTYIPSCEVVIVQFAIHGGPGLKTEGEWGWSPFTPVDITRVPLTDLDYDKVPIDTTAYPKSIIINPQKILANNSDKDFFPSNCIRTFLDNPKAQSLLVSNVILFSDGIVDLHGRKVTQPREYKRLDTGDKENPLWWKWIAPRNAIPIDLNEVWSYTQYSPYFDSREKAFSLASFRGTTHGLSFLKWRKNRGFYQFVTNPQDPDGYSVHLYATDFNLWQYWPYFKNGRDEYIHYSSLGVTWTPIKLPGSNVADNDMWGGAIPVKGHRMIEPGAFVPPEYKVKRNNFITWIDERSVKKLVYLKGGPLPEPGIIHVVTGEIRGNSMYSFMLDSFPTNFPIPNIWASFSKSDF